MLSLQQYEKIKEKEKGVKEYRDFKTYCAECNTVMPKTKFKKCVGCMLK